MHGKQQYLIGMTCRAEPGCVHVGHRQVRQQLLGWLVTDTKSKGASYLIHRYLISYGRICLLLSIILDQIKGNLTDGGALTLFD